jgi:hypothetical protein
MIAKLDRRYFRDGSKSAGPGLDCKLPVYPYERTCSGTASTEAMGQNRKSRMFPSLIFWEHPHAHSGKPRHSKGDQPQLNANSQSH